MFPDVLVGGFINVRNHFESAKWPEWDLGGFSVVTKSRNSYSRLFLSLSAVVVLALAGCGGSSNTNVVTVAVTPSSATIIVSQSITLTSIVSGATNLNVTWACTFTTTTVDAAGKQTVAAAQPCTSDTGNIPANSTDTTVTYTAPNKVPDPTKFPLLQVIITATSVQDTKKSGPATLTLDSGIRVTLTPTTATVPTLEQQQFSASLTNDNDPTVNGVAWLVTQSTPTTTNPSLPNQPTCSPACGSIDATGKYVAPSAVPTTATLTVVASAKADPGRIALGTITIITGGPITFNGLSPTVAPQGASSYDIYLDAQNVSSSSVITITGKNSTFPPLNAGQVKILFPIPTSATPNPSSTGARIRLSAQDLAVADTYTVSMSDPAQPVTQGPGPFKFAVVPTRPTSVASLPDSVLLNQPLGNAQSLAIDGGYFGPTGLFANVGFNGNSLLADPSSSSSRRLSVALPSSDVNAALPGLYPLSVTRTTPPLPATNNPSVTNIAVFPDYSTVFPSVVAATPLPPGSIPSAVDIDTRLGILAVAETASNQVAFFAIGTGSLSPVGTPVAVNAPSGLSINQSNHTVAVVSFQDQSVKVFPLPGSTGDPNVTYPLTIQLAGLINPADVTPLPVPYSIGVDSDTNNAIVAYSSTANPTTAKVGFLLDLNKNTQQTCIGTSSGSPCVHAQVTLNTGANPQVAMLPHSHLAYVTPGGAGVLTGVDVTKGSASVGISSVSLTSGLATVITSSAHGLTPGNPGTVLIQNVAPPADFATTKVNFNGVFSVQSVIDSTTFTYALSSSFNDTSTGGTVYFSSPNITVGVSQTTQGIAINPITRTAAVADANATGNNGPQINLLNSLDQSVSSIIFHSGCTFYNATTCSSSAPELLGTSSVAFQPFANSLVSYNPQQNQLSVSNPVTQQRFAVVCPVVGGTCPATPADQTSTMSITLSGGTATLKLFGGLAVDPATNQAFVVQPASGAIQIVSLRSLKAAQITELQVPTVSGALIGGIPGALMPQGTLTSTTDLVGVQVYGAGFDASTKVRLDGMPIPTTFVSSRNLTVSIPADPFLSVPHRFAVDAVTGGNVQSNATDFIVVKSVDLLAQPHPACSTGTTTQNAQPSSVAIADQLVRQPFHPIAVVTNSGCNSVSVIDIAPQLPVYDTSGNFTGFTSNAQFGTVLNTVPTGSTPQGIALSPRFGLAVISNNSAGTASIIDIVNFKQAVTDVTVGTSPTGVAINEGTGAALIANTASNTVSQIDLTPLLASTPATSLTSTSISIDQGPIAVAIDPDRGTNNRGLAVVTALQLFSGQAPLGVLDAIDIGNATPAKSTSAGTGQTTATPTGIVFDSSVSPALFYVVSSLGNLVTAFNPDTGGTSNVHVGINPTSLAINPQTGGIMTVNSTSQTISIIDTISNPFKTRSTFGIGGSAQFGVAIDQFTNLAVIADQANNRVLIFPIPN
jgi:DNA-binding beta-propeller fold protein YncE